MTDVISSRVSICFRLVFDKDDNWRIRTWRFFPNQRKQLFWFQWGKSCLVWKNWVFAFLLCFEWAGNFLQTSKLFRKPKTLSPSSRRNVNKFSSWASYQRDGSIYLTKVFASDDKLRSALPLKEKGELKFPFWIVLQFSQQEGNLYVSHVY